MSYERDNIRRMTGYTWGEQPRDDTTLKLNTNENPYPPSPAVGAALRGFDATLLRRYPPPLADEFRDRAAALHGLSRDHVLVTHGGDELLRLAITTFLDPGAALGILEPSYSLYPVLAAVQDCPLAPVALDDNWLPPPDAAARWNDAGARLAMVVNPHAPSGTLIAPDALARIAREFRGVLLIDEAYVDFVDPAGGHDTTRLLAAHDNVLLLRTLSKGYSLAGLRYGYGLGDPALIAPMLFKTRDSYNMDAVAQVLASVALGDQAHARDTWQRVRQERARLTAALTNLGLSAPPSQTNFLLVTVPSFWPCDAPAVYQWLKEAGILVRYFPLPRLDDKLRITVGTPAQNDALLHALRALRAGAQPSAGSTTGPGAR